MKEENELRKIKKKEDNGLELGKVLDFKNTFKNVGQAIVQAESEDKLMAEAQTEKIDINDELFLTQHQRKFMKEHKSQAQEIDSDMTAYELEELIEKDLVLVGASAIEDKLQDNVK